MEDDFERMFLRMINQMMNAFNSGAMGVKISVSPTGDVRIDPIRPRRRKIYVPFEVVDAGDHYLLTLDLRQLPKRATTLRVRPDGVLVETPRGERFIYFDEPVIPDTVDMSESNDIVELTVRKGPGAGEKVIRFPG